jgi:hypothetical protein
MDYTNDWSPHADRRQVTSGEEDEAEAEDEAEEAEELLDLVNDAVMLGYLCANLEAERKQAARKGPPQAKERTLCGSLKGRLLPRRNEPNPKNGEYLGKLLRWIARMKTGICRCQKLRRKLYSMRKQGELRSQMTDSSRNSFLSWWTRTISKMPLRKNGQPVKRRRKKERVGVL